MVKKKKVLKIPVKKKRFVKHKEMESKSILKDFGKNLKKDSENKLSKKIIRVPSGIKNLDKLIDRGFEKNHFSPQIPIIELKDETIYNNNINKKNILN